MRQLVADANLVARCGLYCGACRSYLKGKCPGCHDNAKAKWCKVRSCCMEHSYDTCADCEKHADPKECALFNNAIAKVFGLLFNSNRQACIFKIKELGTEGFANHMTELKRQSLPRRAK